MPEFRSRHNNQNQALGYTSGIILAQHLICPCGMFFLTSTKQLMWAGSAYWVTNSQRLSMKHLIGCKMITQNMPPRGPSNDSTESVKHTQTYIHNKATQSTTNGINACKYIRCFLGNSVMPWLCVTFGSVLACRTCANIAGGSLSFTNEQPNHVFFKIGINHKNRYWI